MSIIISHILIVLGCMIPAMIANATPVLVRHIPLGGQAIWLAGLGAHKTWRGLISGTVVGTVVGYYILTQLWTMMSHSGILHFYVHGVSLWLLAFLLSFGALAGDAFKSYRKRRNHIPSGEVFMPWDQIDYIMGAFVLSCWCINWSYIDFMVLTVFMLHIYYTTSYLMSDEIGFGSILDYCHLMLSIHIFVLRHVSFFTCKIPPSLSQRIGLVH